MNMNKTTVFFLIIIVLVMGAIFTLISTSSPSSSVNNSTKYVEFAQCLNDKGAVFYGAFWCTHCKAQKQMLGAPAVKKLNYIECSTADGQNQTKECLDKKIESYPTWEFADMSRLTGEVPLVTLAEKTGCVLPQ